MRILNGIYKTNNSAVSRVSNSKTVNIFKSIKLSTIGDQSTTPLKCYYQPNNFILYTHTYIMPPIY